LTFYIQYIKKIKINETKILVIIHFLLYRTFECINIAVHKYFIIYIGLDACNMCVYVYVCVCVCFNSYNKLMTRKYTVTL